MASAKTIIPFTRNSSWTLNFRILINVVNIVCSGLIGESAVLARGRFEDDFVGFSVIGITAPAISMLWTTACIILLVRDSLRPRHHPAIDLTFDLISWLAFFIFAGWLLAEIVAPEGFVMCSPYYAGVPNRTYCANGGEKQWNIDAALSALFLLNGVVHLVFFSLACQAVKKLRQRIGKKGESYIEMTK